MTQTQEKDHNTKNNSNNNWKQQDKLEFGKQEFLFAQSIHNILSNGFVGELIGDEDDNDKSRKNKNIPDTGKECEVLPDVRKEIKRNMGHGYRKAFIETIDPVIKNKFSHEYSQAKKKKIQTGQYPENCVSEYLSEFYF